MINLLLLVLPKLALACLQLVETSVQPLVLFQALLVLLVVE
jgi:hypothetical protein